jgi:U3 small nucleolar ribonucleoprotein component
MKNPELRYVTQERAAALLGIPENELSRISQESGLGHKERAGNREEIFFTYAELRQICQMTAHVH